MFEFVINCAFKMWYNSKDNSNPTIHSYRLNCNKYASYLDWRISPHADLSFGCIPVNGLRDVRYQHFSLFGLGGANPWAKVHQNRRQPATHPGLPSCQISLPRVNPRRRYPLQNICGQRKLQTKKKTVKDISPPHLLARGNKKITQPSTPTVGPLVHGQHCPCL